MELQSVIWTELVWAWRWVFPRGMLMGALWAQQKAPCSVCWTGMLLA